MTFPTFPTYLVPSIPFRRRQSSSASSVSSNNSPPSTSYLTNTTSHLRCSRCLSDLAFTSQIVSKGFTGRHGRAYLVAPSTSPSSLIDMSLPVNSNNARAFNAALPNLPNTFTDRPVPRQLVTGAHTVSDVHCRTCGACLGWKYVAAEQESQRYKVGKFILEAKRVYRDGSWALDDVDEGAGRAGKGGLVEDDVEFDSQDEDECEALFMGVWTPQMATQMRKSKDSIARVDD
ncbi:yippee-domain-containing protein [Dissoconium aciculare CBS 342.82]|uniref:Yippee-domain-containing protein n=1 Tax=Dissoconium aciculare CBS 342.82 TaxID=1314786 RepID=A0A6J3LRI4_9PEZI|nr:yippee-domain-containing protein [Dissoconium aciculare CBS 342.82]KAF1818446.1 yippee-domain-containing protein [Dissoconium aciculare CBS 342.82]